MAGQAMTRPLADRAESFAIAFLCMIPFAFMPFVVFTFLLSGVWK